MSHQIRWNLWDRFSNVILKERVWIFSPIYIQQIADSDDGIGRDMLRWDILWCLFYISFVFWHRDSRDWDHGGRRESDTDYGNIFPLSPLDTGHSISIILIALRRGWLHLWSPVAGLHLLLIFYTRGTEKIIGFIKIVESFGSNMWVLSFILNCNYRQIIFHQ